MRRTALTSILALTAAALSAQQPPPSGPRPEVVRVIAPASEAEVGQTLTFKAEAFDAAGKKIEAQPSAWFATPFDVGVAEPNGNVTAFAAGELVVGAIVNGKPGTVTIRVKPESVARIDVVTPPSSLVVGAGVALQPTARTKAGIPRDDAAFTWTSSSPAVATVDPAGLVTGVAPGKTTIRVQSGTASAEVPVTVIRNPVASLAVEPRTTTARTGDVVRFTVKATSSGGAPVTAPAIRWSVGAAGASIDPDGGFVAERPGSYVVTATSGDRSGAASIVITPRNVGRELMVVGRTPLEDFQTLEQWIVGNFAYVTSAISGKLWVYDISNPAQPLKVDTLSFDARVLNDFSISADKKLGILTMEGSSTRKDGIVLIDTSDLAHPKVIGTYNEGVTGGVHSAFIDGHHVYLTDDATGSLRVLNVEDPKRPREVARWKPDSFTKTVAIPDHGEVIAGVYLHDVYVKDGLAYLAYWRDGLVILDVGAGLKGGSPASPKPVSQIRFNYSALYGPGWLAGAHAVFRYKNYVFVGDEVFPARFDLVARDRIPTKGVVHVVDVSDIAHPRDVAVYDVPEAGAHNMWVEDDLMYMGYYGAGARVVDVSGELRGDLYRQGREVARLWTGDPKGYRPNLPFTWGAQPHNGMIFFNDINTGIWITKLNK
jgi:uncharacterized protein YjdB